MERFAVALEIGPKRRVFAQAFEWIGWCRAGKDELAALNHLVAAGLRYARVAERAGLTFGTPPSLEAFEIVERMHLSAFGHTFQQPDPAHVAEQEAAVREQLLAELRAVPRKVVLIPRRRYGFAWTPRFVMRRSSWHALDHAWELQERRDR